MKRDRRTTAATRGDARPVATRSVPGRSTSHEDGARGAIANPGRVPSAGKATLVDGGRPIQCKPGGGRASAPSQPAAGSGVGLPVGVKQKMERSFRADFSEVRVHVDGSADSMGALAYARGSDIHFSPGRYDPSSRAGQQLLGHELAHVVQQRAGRVAVPQGKGAPVNADESLEREADTAGERAARGLPAGLDGDAPGRSSVEAPIQGKFVVGSQYKAVKNVDAWDGKQWIQVNADLACVADLVDGAKVPGKPGAQRFYQVRTLDGKDQTLYIKKEDADDYGLWDLADRPRSGLNERERPHKTKVGKGSGTKYDNVAATITDWDAKTSRMVGFGEDATDLNGNEERLRTEVKWGPLQPGYVQQEGSWMEALVGPDHPRGSPPNCDTQVNSAAIGKQCKKTTWIAGHMLNDNLGGSGEDVRNIIAIPSVTNHQHNTEVEEKIKMAVNSEGKWVHYRLEVTSRHADNIVKQFKTLWYEVDANRGPASDKRVNTFNVPQITEVDALSTAHQLRGDADKAKNAKNAKKRQKLLDEAHELDPANYEWSKPDVEKVQSPDSPMVSRVALGLAKQPLLSEKDYEQAFPTEYPATNTVCEKAMDVVYDDTYDAKHATLKLKTKSVVGEIEKMGNTVGQYQTELGGRRSKPTGAPVRTAKGDALPKGSRDDVDKLMGERKRRRDPSSTTQKLAEGVVLNDQLERSVNAHNGGTKKQKLTAPPEWMQPELENHPSRLLAVQWQAFNKPGDYQGFEEQLAAYLSHADRKESDNARFISLLSAAYQRVGNGQDAVKWLQTSLEQYKALKQSDLDAFIKQLGGSTT